jgi:hypothetical protein
MTAYKTRWFDRWARKQGLFDAQLCGAIAEMEAGLFEANLGAGLFKKRIARAGQGKSAGFRTLVATRHEGRWFFVFGFAKNVRSNIDKDEEYALKRLALYLLEMSDTELETAQNAGEVIGVNCNA